jgi:cell wall-associated NlpC family hydrolase
MLHLAKTPARAAITAAVLAWACGTVQAAPDTTSPDAITKLLRDKGQMIDAGMQQTAAMAAAAVQPAARLGAQMRDATSDLVLSAMNFMGVRYRRGGNDSENGFDCSGFTRAVFENSLGLLLPRRVDEQARASGLLPVKRDQLQPGDLVFFNTLKRTFSHVGIYVGEGKFIHAPKPGGEVRVESMDVRYWAKRFTGARRAEQVAEPAVSPAAPASPAPVILDRSSEQNFNSP